MIRFNLIGSCSRNKHKLKSEMKKGRGLLSRAFFFVILSFVILSMNAAGSMLDRHLHDQPLYLTPTAEMDMIAEIAAAVGTNGSLITGIGAEIPDKQRRFFIPLAAA